MSPEGAGDFRAAITSFKENSEDDAAAAVFAYSDEEYAGMRLFVSDDGSTGFALKPTADGVDLVSVFSAVPGRSAGLLELAVQAGGTRATTLDCFDIDGFLPSLYAAHGFVLDRREAWNPEFAPDGWPASLGTPDVVFMHLDRAGLFEAESPAPQRLKEEGDGGVTRGWTDVVREGSDTLYRVALTDAKDASTFLHESAHIFLDVFARLAARADAPTTLKRDFDIALKWLGVESADGVQTAHHEKWARAFEAYFAEGKPPAKGMAGSFQRFRLWLGDIYRDLSALGRVTPDIRGVFDRLLATDAEIDANVRAMGLQALPRSVLGLDAAGYQQHLDELAEAVSAARAQADLAVTRDKLRETETWWKETHARFKREAGEEYEALPARKVQLLLQGKEVDGWLGLNQALHRGAVEAWVGVEAGKKFRLAADGLHPDDLASLEGNALGFGDGRSLVEAVASLPDKADFVEARADVRMVEEYPGVLDERQRLREEVQRGLHGNLTKEWALREWAALTAQQRKQLRGEAAATVPSPPPPAVLKHVAQLLANGTPAGKLGIPGALAAERRASVQALRAAQRGDFATAAVWKQKQVLNMYLFEALTEAKREVEAMQTLAARLLQPPSQRRMGKASPEYRDAANALMAAFGLADEAPGAREALPALLLRVEGLMAENSDTVGFDRERLLDRLDFGPAAEGDWRVLNVEDARHLHAALKNINAAVRNRTKVRDGQRLIELELAVTELVAEAETALPERPGEPTPEAATYAQGFGRGWSAFDGSMLKTETMARMLAGDDDMGAFVKSSWYRLIIQPIQHAKARAHDLAHEVLKPLVDAWDNIPEETQERWDEMLPPGLFPTHIDERVPQRRWEILMLLLNSGNASNLQRVTEGRNITEAQIRHAAEVVGITKEEYDWVQGVWDASEKLKPLAFDLEEADSGVRPQEIPAVPFDTPHGTMRGGYFPAVYDREVSEAGRVQSLADLASTSYTRPGTSHGHLKSRAEGFSDVISLSPSSITRHFHQVIHDVAYRRAVKSVGTLLLRPEVRKVMRRRLGSGRAEQFEVWLRDVATQRGASGNDGVRWWSSLYSQLRSNLSIAVLGYSLRNAGEDASSNLTAAVTAGELKRASLTAAMAELAENPARGRAFVLSKSGEMRSRRESTKRFFVEQVSKLSLGPVGRLFGTGPLGFFRAHAFVFQEWVEVGTGTPVWLGAYRQALADGMEDAAAVEYAEGVVRQVLVSRDIADLSALMRNKGAIGAMLMFFSFFNHAYNNYRQMAGRFVSELRQGDTERAAQVAGAVAGMTVGYWLLGPIVRGQGPEKDEPIEEWLLRKMVLEGLMQVVPGMNVIGEKLSADLRGHRAMGRDNSLFGAVSRIYDSVAKLLETEGDVVSEARLKALLGVAGPVAGQPTVQPMRELTPVWRWVEGENEWRNPFDAASDVAYGRQPQQPWNVLQAIGDAIEGEERQ